jgi:hypothetical protein
MPAKNPKSYCLVFQQIICHCSSFLGTAECRSDPQQRMK